MIEVVIQDEDGGRIASLENTSDVLGRLPHVSVAARSRFHLLRYLEPYGDTVFNSLQFPDLLRDLAAFQRERPDEETAAYLDGLRALIRQAEEEAPHVYLRFIGD